MKIETSKNIILILLSLLLLGECMGQRIKLSNYPQKFVPPGTVSISDSLFYDEIEVTNLYWLDYLSWISHVYGDTSLEYNETYTFRNVWSKLYKVDQKLGVELTTSGWTYFRHPAYNSFPAICISQEQAEKYCQWRSDRVFEQILCSNGVIAYNSNQTPENHFTIERFFNGEIERLKKVEITYYPEYSLPTYEDYQTALAYSDTLISAPKRKKSKIIDYNLPYSSHHRHVQVALGDSLKILPVYPSLSGNYYWPLYHLRGNVSEWLSEPNMTVGGSWNDSPEIIEKQHLFPAQEPAPWIGFRCVCRMKRWEGGKATK